MIHDEHANTPPEGEPQPISYARRGTLVLQGTRSETELQEAVDAFLSELTGSLKEQGCKLIGHIKGILEAGEKGHLFFSVTSFHGKTRYKGKLTGRFTKVDFALNVIVYGVGSERIEQAVLEGLRNHFGGLSQRNR